MNAGQVLPRRGLYLITPDLPSTETLLAHVAPLLALGVAMLQLRCKHDAGCRREQALALLPLCRARGVPLLINDDWALAADIGADGAHLGADDGGMAEARAALGAHAIVGASCYAELALAARAAAAGASYVAFGAVFPSSTKSQAKLAPLALFSQARGLGLPTVAIGGITPDNARQVIAAGADFIAVIGAVADAPDPAAVVRAFRSCFDETANEK